jgi:hypothetical protein
MATAATNKTPPATASASHATSRQTSTTTNNYDEDTSNNAASSNSEAAGRSSLGEGSSNRGNRTNSLAEPTRRDVLGLPPSKTGTTTSMGSPTEQTISYSAERIIGNGSFGVVFQAAVVETGEIVAIKKVLQDKRFKNRELQIMRLLVKDGHSNIVALKHCFYSQVSFKLVRLLV